MKAKSRRMTNCLHFFLLLFPLTFTLYPLSSQSNAAEFKEIQQRGYLLVAVKDNLPPLGFRDRQGKLRGLEIELAQKLATDLLGDPAAVKFIPVTNRDRLSHGNRLAIASGKFQSALLHGWHGDRCEKIDSKKFE